MFSELWSIWLDGAHARETTGECPYASGDEKEAWESGWNSADLGISKVED
jgi:hypothetical protein